MIFTKRYRYRFGDIDHAGIAYYPALLHYFHCAMEDWWAERFGVPYATVMRDERFGMPAVHLDADFFRPIRYGDEPEISVAVLKLGTTSIEIGFWMTVAPEAKPACRARVVTVAVDLDTMRKCEVPARWRAVFERYQIAGLPEG